jgi:nucleotidyltransferase/DNA polymerase involved in DNA repair
MNKPGKFPPGWDEERVRRVLKHYESQSEVEAVAADEAALDASVETVMSIPRELVPEVRELIARRKKGG